MEKLKEIEFDIKRYRIPDIYRNKYDFLFDQKRIFYGQGYYMDHRVDKLNISDNVVTAVVRGTTNYNVKINFFPNDEIDVYCQCPYHKDTNKYCKHIYAVLIAVHMKDIINDYINEYHDNINRIKKIMDDYTNLLVENKEYLSYSTKMFLPSTPKSYLKEVKEMEEEFDPSNEKIILNLAQRSRFRLLSVIDSYNYLIDTITKDKKEYEEAKKEEKNDTITHTFEVGPDQDKLFKYLDNLMASQDLNVLLKAREQCIKDGTPTDVIDKAINERKRRDKEALTRKVKDSLKEGIEEQRRAHKMAKRYRKQIRRAIISGLFSGLLGSSNSSNPDIMPWEQDYIDKGDYEPYQFEEEELEEDDFYNEDD